MASGGEDMRASEAQRLMQGTFDVTCSVAAMAAAIVFPPTAYVL